MNWLRFREGFWGVIQVVALLALVWGLWENVRKPKTRQSGIIALAVLCGLGLIVGLVRGFGVRIVMGG